MGQDPSIYVLVNQVRSLYNVGSIFRTADAMGVKKIYLSGYSGIVRHGNNIDLHPKLSKTALEGVDVDWEHTDNPVETIKQLKSQGVQIVALEQTDKSENYLEADFKLPVCLIVGHERDGVEKEILDICDRVVEISMEGRGISLNVSVALAVVIFEIKRQFS